jgi:uncharacterized protein YdhG (YjbR/CyaY superfamily)
MTDAVSEYIARQKTPQKEICQQLRIIISNTYPGFKEEMKWGVPAYADGLFYFVALKNHVNLGFSIENLSEEEKKYFDGGGKTTQKIEISSLADVNPKRINWLLEFVKERQKKWSAQ